MKREDFVGDITARFREVVEHLLDQMRAWPQGHWLGVAEHTTREAMLELGTSVLEGLIAELGSGHCGPVHTDDKGQQRKFKDYRARKVTTLVGTVQYERATYHSKSADPSGVSPLDARLGVKGAYSEGVEELVAFTAAQLTYAATIKLLAKTLGGEPSDTKVEQVIDTWGKQCEQDQHDRLPREEPKQRMAVAVDGAMIRTACRRRKRRGSRKQHFDEHWAEAKLGVVYSFGRGGKAHRDKRYTASLSGRDPFGQQLWHRIEASGADRAKQVVWLGDGAEWVWTLKAEHLPHAIEVLDFYHASEHLRTVAAALWGRGSKRAKRWVRKRHDQLKAGQVHKVIDELERQAQRVGRPRRNTRDDDPRKIVADNVRYFERNRSRMDYKRYRQRGYPISSGAVESGCRHVIAQRMKITGSMSWRRQRADALLQLRCLIRSNQWDELWPLTRLVA